MKRNPPRAPLESLDEQNARAGIHIAHAPAKRFSKTEASAVEGEQQCAIELRPKPRAIKTGAEFQQFQNVLFGKKIRNEGGLGWQLRPERFHDSAVGQSGAGRQRTAGEWLHRRTRSPACAPVCSTATQSLPGRVANADSWRHSQKGTGRTRAAQTPPGHIHTLDHRSLIIYT